MTIGTFKVAQAKTLSKQDILFDRDETESNVRSSGIVILGDFEPIPQAQLPAGAIDIDDLVDMFSEEPELSEAISKGRKWVSDSFYNEEITLASLRLKSGYSQRQLADVIGTSQPYIARLEAGQVKPQLDTLEKLAKALSIKTYELTAALLGEKIE